LQDLFEQFWEILLAKLPNIQAYINKLKSTRERIIGTGGILDDEQMKAKMMGSFIDQYAHFKTAYRLMPKTKKETIDQISQLLIGEKHTRLSARLEKKNIVHYIFSNRQSEFGSPQTSSLLSKNKCKTCICFHKSEYHVKTGKIPDN
jgi:gag-polypeptide of LTR copia-type